jgi:hypothetical protein
MVWWRDTRGRLHMTPVMTGLERIALQGRPANCRNIGLSPRTRSPGITVTPPIRTGTLMPVSIRFPIPPSMCLTRQKGDFFTVHHFFHRLLRHDIRVSCIHCIRLVTCEQLAQCLTSERARLGARPSRGSSAARGDSAACRWPTLLRRSCSGALGLFSIGRRTLWQRYGRSGNLLSLRQAHANVGTQIERPVPSLRTHGVEADEGKPASAFVLRDPELLLSGAAATIESQNACSNCPIKLCLVGGPQQVDRILP